MPTEGARERSLSEKFFSESGPTEWQFIAYQFVDFEREEIFQFADAVAASAVARESAEHEKALLAVIDERDTLESDIENIARELGCNEDATNLHSHSECALSAAMSVDDRIKAAVARERERLLAAFKKLCADIDGMTDAELERELES